MKNSISGPIVTPDESDYDTQRKPWLQVVDQHPSVIVNALATGDIAEPVRVARESQLSLGVQHTGLGIAIACNHGTLLRLVEMNGISVDARAATATTIEELALIAQGAMRSMRESSPGEYSYNWLRGDQQKLVARTFRAEKFARLKDLKRRYDPEMFRLNLNISPD